MLREELLAFRNSVAGQFELFIRAGDSNDSLSVQVCQSIRQVIHQELDRFDHEINILSQLYDFCVLFLHRRVKTKEGGGGGGE